MATQNEPGKQGKHDHSMKSPGAGKRSAEQSAGRQSETDRKNETRERAFPKDDGNMGDAASQKRSQAKPMSQAERNRRDPLIDTPDNAARSNRPGVDRPTGAPAERIAREQAANPKFDDAGRAEDGRSKDGRADDTRKAADIQSGARNRKG